MPKFPGFHDLSLGDGISSYLNISCGSSSSERYKWSCGIERVLDWTESVDWEGGGEKSEVHFSGNGEFGPMLKAGIMTEFTLMLVPPNTLSPTPLPLIQRS